MITLDTQKLTQLRLDKLRLEYELDKINKAIEEEENHIIQNSEIYKIFNEKNKNNNEIFNINNIDKETKNDNNEKQFKEDTIINREFFRVNTRSSKLKIFEVSFGEEEIALNDTITFDINNISIGGFSFFSKIVFPTDVTFKGRIIDEKLNYDIEINGKLVWHFKDRDNYHYGCKFVNLNPKADSLLGRYVNILQLNKIRPSRNRR